MDEAVHLLWMQDCGGDEDNEETAEEHDVRTGEVLSRDTDDCTHSGDHHHHRVDSREARANLYLWSSHSTRSVHVARKTKYLLGSHSALSVHAKRKTNYLGTLHRALSVHVTR